MKDIHYEIWQRKIILRLKERACDSPEELLRSRVFSDILYECIQSLKEQNSFLLNIFDNKEVDDERVRLLVRTLEFLAVLKGELVPRVVPGAEMFFRNPDLFNEFIEYLYNFWRSFDRFILCDSTGNRFDIRPYRTFNLTIEHLTDLIRKTYRDLQENITGRHPKIYRQVEAGAEVAAIAFPAPVPFGAGIYKGLNDVPVIRQVLLFPPLILNPPMNKRTGQFERTDTNPVQKVGLNPRDWLCYPAKVGELIVLVYVYKEFYELGLSLCNLFEIADDEDLMRKPDAVYFYGIPEETAGLIHENPTVFYDDTENDMLVASVPRGNAFSYFGYLKKMMLTLHNIRMMKAGRLPFHGALVRITLRGERVHNVLIIGDSGAGKSESLEALRHMGRDRIQDFIVIADDMGSLEIDPDMNIVAYGTETGAFLRLDDLKPGYAFGQLDRSIIMNPGLTNARIILPVTPFEYVVRGHPVDFIFYANNYEEIDESHPVIESFSTPESALEGMNRGHGLQNKLKT